MDSHAHKFQLPEEHPSCVCYYHAPELHSAGGCLIFGCPCKWDGVLRSEPHDTEPAPPIAKPYEVQHGFYLMRTKSYRTFEAALAFVEGMLAISPYAKTEYRVLNRSRYDGDNMNGLTAEEREELEAL